MCPVRGSQHAAPYLRIIRTIDRRLHICIPISLFIGYALLSEVPSRLFALCNLLGPPSLNRFLRLFPSIYNYSLPEFFGHKGNK